MKFRSCFDLFSSPSATKLKLVGPLVADLSFPLTGNDKIGVMVLIASRAPLSLPFPIKGKGFPRCGDTPPFSFSAGERKLMTHFVVRNYFP
jgi:hypothetical protein